VLAPFRGSTDEPTIFAAFFGDTAAREAGYPPLGLPPLAGLALASAEQALLAASRSTQG
jgi:hypothetical protein